MASRQLTSPWQTYARERYPVAVYLLLSAGYVLTGWAVTKASLSWAAFGYGMLCYMVFFFTLRLMDELKDFAKDQLAHPRRPLPRGLLTPDQARRGIVICMAAMLTLSLIAGFAFTPASGCLFGFSSFYLWLMYKEFYVGHRLGEWPLIYAITHQVISLPLVFFSACLFDAGAMHSAFVLPASVMILGAFFCYEVCRKLDPAAHPVLRTYLGVYGRPKTVTIVVLAAAVAAAAAYQLGMPLLFWIFEALVVASFLLPRERYKVTETLATLSLAVHVLGLPILRATGVFPS